MSKVLCTGAKGFIASQLVSRLRDNGDDVTEFDIVNGQDICNQRQVQKAIEGKDVVFHLAAVADLNWARVHPNQTMQINVDGTWNVAMACKKTGAKLYFSSTCCVFGNQKVHPVTEETLPNPSEIYACTKLAGEAIIKGLHYTYGLQYNMMRFATIYGEGARAALGTHIFMGQALRGEPITVHGDGKQTRTLTHVEDLIDSIMALYNSEKINDIWNLTTEEEVSANKMAESIKEITKSKSPIIYVPQRVGQTYKEQVSAQKMLKECGWKAKVSWDEGIRRQYEWFKYTNQIKNIYIEPK